MMKTIAWKLVRMKRALTRDMTGSLRHTKKFIFWNKNEFGQMTEEKNNEKTKQTMHMVNG